MSYPFDAATLAAITRLGTNYNGNAYNAGSNPYGLAAGGHRVNFVPSLQDLAVVGDSVADAADAAAISATAAAASDTASALNAERLQGTSTTSLSIATGAKSFVTQADKFFNVGTYVWAVSAADPTTHYMAGQVTAYLGTSLTVNVQAIAGSGTKVDWNIYSSASPGATGPTGVTGAQGETPTAQWTFGNGTTDSDPGNGILLINNATYNAATFLYVDNLDRHGNSLTALLDTWDDSTNTANRGRIFLQQIGSAAVYAEFRVTGAVVDGTGYRKIPVTHLVSSQAGGGLAFTNAANLAVLFSRTGDKGADGGGAGDVISDISSSTEGRFAVMADTTGKHIIQASFGIGTSGANIGALSTANTWGGVQTFIKVDLTQDFYLTGDITPTQISANTDNYAPTGNATASVMRISTDASRDLTGIANGADGRLLKIFNVGSFDLVLKNDVTSTAANRFLFGGDITLRPSDGIELLYDATSTRWRRSGGLTKAADIADSTSVGRAVMVATNEAAARTAIIAGKVDAVTVQAFTSGSGTYTKPAGCTWIRPRMVGGGGGGAGSGTGGGSAPGTGGTSTFGTTLLSADGGAGGSFADAGGAGGAASLGTGPLGFVRTGAAGGGVGTISGQSAERGGGGGSTPFAGGTQTKSGGAGANGIANTGTGGSGSGGTAGNYSGAGGGAGGYVDAIIVTPDATYAYAVGAGGTAGGAGASGFAGGAGGSGFIIVEEHYD